MPSIYDRCIRPSATWTVVTIINRCSMNTGKNDLLYSIFSNLKLRNCFCIEQSIYDGPSRWSSRDLSRFQLCNVKLELTILKKIIKLHHNFYGHPFPGNPLTNFRRKILPIIASQIKTNIL